jgi:hypothetical protein
MNKQEAQRKIEDLRSDISKLEKIINEPKNNGNEMSDFLFSMLKETKMVINNGMIINYRLSDNEWLIQQDYENGYLWVRYSLIWSVFETKFGLNYQQISDFIKGWMKKNTEMGPLTPRAIESSY